MVYVRKVFVTAGRSRDVDRNEGGKDVEETNVARIKLQSVSEQPGRRLP